GVMNEAVDDGDGHRLVGEDFAPIAERLIGRDEQGSPFIAGADEFEEHTGFVEPAYLQLGNDGWIEFTFGAVNATAELEHGPSIVSFRWSGLTKEMKSPVADPSS